MHEVNEYRFNSTPHMWIFIKLVLFAFCTFIFKYYSGGVVEEIPDNRTSLASETRIEDANQMNFTDAVDTKLDQGKRITRILITQPSCSIMDTLMILDDICADLKMSKTGCRPQDVNDPSKHKIPKMYYAKNQSTNETENNIVNYIIAALLLTSLGAALLELYRAKTSHQPAVAERRGGSKVSLNRKCSLADLTVLKHNRKELVRRESVLEQTREEGLQTTSKQGRNPCRPPMRVD
ncbi:uncharacterized protein LOC132699039 isoform X2 [Cylas formicarius]|uniref:uncharacterized protein LOC132699039 isoform X2 n=1 Tax=Cylas formicarius TaxID=197179 RepID=UPI002958D25F|nr:uncharacterized protein LOC132699039 isoform X2 [Cylas formicarius]